MKTTTLPPFSEKLFQIYCLFTRAELREFQRWLASPFFHADSRLQKLHQYLSSGTGSHWADKKKASKAATGHARYQEKTFRYLVSELLHAAEDFIYYSEVRKVQPYYVHYLDEYYSQRQSDACKQQLKKRVTGNRFVTKRKQKVEDLLHAHFLSELKDELHSTSLKEYAQQVVGKRSVAPSGLDDYYLIEKLRQLCITANDNNVFGVHTAVHRQPETLQWATARAGDQFLVKTYLHVYAMLSNNSEADFDELKRSMRQLALLYDEQVVSELFTYARNYCIAQVNAGRQKFYAELFDLYRHGLDNRILLVNGELNERNFKNIVTTALRIGELKWTEEFVSESRHLLNSRVRENAYHYNLANLLFHQKRFEKSLQALQRVQLNDLFYALDARSLTIKCFFELDEREAFLNAYNSFKQYVQRKKVVSRAHRTNYLHFLSLARQLMNVRPRDKHRVEAIGRKIETSRQLADKSWLLEKWQQLQ